MLSTLRRVSWEEQFQGVRPGSSLHKKLLAQVIDFARENQHPLRLADAVGKHDRPSDDLVGLLGIDAEAHRQLDRLVRDLRAMKASAPTFR